MGGLRRIKHFIAQAAGVRRRAIDAGCDGGADCSDAAGRATAEDAAQMETGALVAHIEARYHAAHRRDVPELVRLAAHVEAAHRDHPAAPLGLADCLAQIRSEMEQHLKKEELGLFPMLTQADRPDFDAAIAILSDEHEAHGARLRELEALTSGHTPPADACRAWRALYAGTRTFAADLREHIRLEDDVLFPRFAGRPGA